VEELRQERNERFKMVEDALKEHTGSNEKRITMLEGQMADLKAAREAKMNELDKTIADMNKKWGERFERIETVWKSEVSDRFATTQALDKKTPIGGRRAPRAWG